MKPNGSILGASALSISILSGCGGIVQAPLAVTQSTAARPDRAGSWMAPEAKGEDLMYVGAPGESYSKYFVYVFSYPGGKRVGRLSAHATGLCSDQNGNVFITEGSGTGASTIVEYAHGGAKPIKKLTDPDNGAAGCAVDPVTGNLAVANSENFRSPGTVAVYPQSSGTPTTYQLSFWTRFCGYDGNGNLFVTGTEQHRAGLRYPLFELAKGGSEFTRIRLKKHVEYAMGVQWDGNYIVLGEGTNNYNNGRLRQYTIRGDKGVFEGGIKLGVNADSFFVQGSTVIVADGANSVWFLSYPGGVREKEIRLYSSYGVTVSMGTSR